MNGFSFQQNLCYADFSRLRKKLIVVFSSVILIAMSGCFSDSGTNPAPVEDPGTAPPTGGTPPAVGTQQQYEVGQAGGTLVFTSTVHDVTLTLVIPAGALDGNTVFTIDHAQSFPSGVGLVTGAVFDVGPDGLVFNIPAELSITYGMDLIGGLPEDDLRIHKASGADWMPLLGSVDSANKVISASINSLSIFGLKTIPVGGTGASGNPNATLDWLQTNVFGGVCSQCHTGAGAPMGVDWSSAAAMCSNVGRASGGMPAMKVIESGNAAASYVIWKVEGAGPNAEPIVGGQMPPSNGPLTAETIQNLRDWIADGTPGCQTQQSTGSVDSSATKFDLPVGGDPQVGSIYPMGSWAHVWNETLQLCATCHSLISSNPRCLTDLQCPPNGVVLSKDNYFGVVDGYTVAPFDPEGSNLWRRVTEEDPHERMPFGLAPLTQTQLNIIRNWIADGAPFCPQNDVCP